MKCPFCKTEDAKVIDSRSAGDGFIIRRRRECLQCQKRFTTYEQIEDIQIKVVKKDGRREPFDIQKIIKGIQRACEKRPVSSETITSIAQKIEGQIYNLFEKEISASFIGERIMDELKKVDSVAYVRFASVYREFKDVFDFLKEVNPILEKEENTEENDENKQT